MSNPGPDREPAARSAGAPRPQLYLFISHQLNLVRYASDRIAVMYLGRIVELGPAAEVASRPRHPYTQLLLAAEPHPDPARREETVAVLGEVPSPLDPPSGCAFHPRCPLADAGGTCRAHHCDVTRWDDDRECFDPRSCRSDFPTTRDGARGVYFVHAAADSHEAGASG